MSLTSGETPSPEPVCSPETAFLLNNAVKKIVSLFPKDFPEQTGGLMEFAIFRDEPNHPHQSRLGNIGSFKGVPDGVSIEISKSGIDGNGYMKVPSDSAIIYVMGGDRPQEDPNRVLNETVFYLRSEGPPLRAHQFRDTKTVEDLEEAKETECLGVLSDLASGISAFEEVTPEST